MAKKKLVCYTFIRTLQDWNEIFEGGVMYGLTTKQVTKYSKFIVLTKDFEWIYKKKPVKKCGCK